MSVYPGDPGPYEGPGGQQYLPEQPSPYGGPEAQMPYPGQLGYGILGIREANRGRADNKALSITGIVLAIFFNIVYFIVFVVKVSIDGGAGY